MPRPASSAFSRRSSTRIAKAPTQTGGGCLLLAAGFGSPWPQARRALARFSFRQLANAHPLQRDARRRLWRLARAASSTRIRSHAPTDSDAQPHCPRHRTYSRTAGLAGAGCIITPVGGEARQGKEGAEPLAGAAHPTTARHRATVPPSHQEEQAGALQHRPSACGTRRASGCRSGRRRWRPRPTRCVR